MVNMQIFVNMCLCIKKEIITFVIHNGNYHC